MSDNGSNSDWIYILLTLVAGALSLLKSQSAKKRPVTRQTPESPEIFGDSFDEREDAAADEAEFYEKHENPYLHFTPESGSGISDESFQEAELQPEGEEEEENAFDLRKAVISSEILKRKFD